MTETDKLYRHLYSTQLENIVNCLDSQIRDESDWFLEHPEDGLDVEEHEYKIQEVKKVLSIYKSHFVVSQKISDLIKFYQV